MNAEELEQELTEAKAEIERLNSILSVHCSCIFVPNELLEECSYHAALRTENATLTDCLNGSSKGVYTAEMYDTLRKQCEEAEQLHSELLYEVEEKYPGETRHQTAKRFIKERQAIADCSAAKKEAES